MKNPFTNDTAILDALRSGVPSRVSAAIEHLYRSDKVRGAVRHVIRPLGGDESDVSDMLNQALIVFINQVETNQYEPEKSAITTYIANITRKKFFTQQRSEKRRSAWHNRSAESEAVERTTNPEEQVDLEHRRQFIHKFLGRIGEKCRELLLLKAEGYQMEEIAEKMQYKSADSAKSAHHDCRKKLNDLTQRPEVLQALREL